MRRNKLSLSLSFALLCAILLAASFAPVHAAEEKVIRILGTSDTHGMFFPFDYAQNAETKSGSMAQIATIIKDLRNENTLILDAGDTIQDNSSDLFLDDPIHPMIEAMNLIGYDTWTLGNHEFNYGIPKLEHVMGQFTGKTLCANVFYKDGKPFADPYAIFERDGVKIGVIGVVTPNITRWDAMNLEGYKVTDPVKETKKIIAEIKDQVDVLIAAVHMSENNEYGVENSGTMDLANQCPELNLIIAAHEHKGVAGVEYNGILLVENASHGKSVAKVDITVAKGDDGKYKVVNRESELIMAKEVEPDAGLMTALADQDQKAKEYAQTVIGKLEGGDLVPANEIDGIPQSQIQDTAMIDLINAVQMHYADARVSAAAVFNIKSNIKEGEIKRSDTSLIYKYNNTLYSLEMTGHQLKKFMEWAAKYYNTWHEGDLTISFNPEIRAYNYDMFSGVKYDVDISREAGDRIVNLTWMDGTPVKEDETFVVAVNNYRANSQLLSYGEVYEEADGLPKLLEIDIRGELGGVRELIGDYIINVKNGILNPEVDNNWKVIGNNWDPVLHQKVTELVKEGKITIPTSEDGRTPNVKSITDKDIQ